MKNLTVYTGFGTNSFLYITEKSIEELAELMECTHYTVKDEDGTMNSVFARKPCTKSELEQIVIDGDPPHGVWIVYQSQFELDTNLYNAVCW